MSIYDHRDKPAYGLFETDPDHCRNPHILQWWTLEHDALLATQIARWHWVWYWTITDEVVRITPSSTLESWEKTDPLCSKYAWNTVLMYFAAVMSLYSCKNEGGVSTLWWSTDHTALEGQKGYSRHEKDSTK
jgi:hypothetical protein